MKDKTLRWIAKRLPQRLRYWVVVNSAAFTDGNPGGVTALEMLDNLSGVRRRKTGSVGTIPCPIVAHHDAHSWMHYNSETGRHETVQCQG